MPSLRHAHLARDPKGELDFDMMVRVVTQLVPAWSNRNNRRTIAKYAVVQDVLEHQSVVVLDGYNTTYVEDDTI